MNFTPQTIMAEAAEKLLEAVREVGSSPSPFAVALLELMEYSTKLQQFDDMLEDAKKEASSDEAKTWQQISLITLQYCRQGLVEKQQRAMRTVCDLAAQGATLTLHQKDT